MTRTGWGEREYIVKKMSSIADGRLESWLQEADDNGYELVQFGMRDSTMIAIVRRMNRKMYINYGSPPTDSL